MPRLFDILCSASDLPILKLRYPKRKIVAAPRAATGAFYKCRADNKGIIVVRLSDGAVSSVLSIPFPIQLFLKMKASSVPNS